MCFNVDMCVCVRRGSGVYTEPATKAILLQAASPVNRCQWQRNNSMPEKRAEPMAVNPHCIGDRH